MPSGDDVFNSDIQKGPQEWVQIPLIAPALWENPFQTKAAPATSVFLIVQVRKGEGGKIISN